MTGPPLGVCMCRNTFFAKAAPAGGGRSGDGVDGLHLGERGARDHPGIRTHRRLLGYQ